jgi:copper chaperone
MEILKFKTNLEKQENVAAVSSFLDKESNITNWQVDTDSEDKILSISGENIDPQTIENGLNEVGYKAEVLRIVGASGEGL